MVEKSTLVLTTLIAVILLANAPMLKQISGAGSSLVMKSATDYGSPTVTSALWISSDRVGPRPRTVLTLELHAAKPEGATVCAYCTMADPEKARQWMMGVSWLNSLQDKHRLVQVKWSWEVAKAAVGATPPVPTYAPS